MQYTSRRALGGRGWPLKCSCWAAAAEQEGLAEVQLLLELLRTGRFLASPKEQSYRMNENGKLININKKLHP